MSICDSLGAFADGELSPRDAKQFREHLPGCVPCQNGLLDHMTFAARISELGNDAMPPAGWEQRVMTAVEVPAPKRSWWRRLWRRS